MGHVWGTSGSEKRNKRAKTARDVGALQARRHDVLVENVALNDKRILQRIFMKCAMILLPVPPF